MSAKVHNTRCVDLLDCAQRGITRCATRAIADWHYSLAQRAPKAETRGRHLLLAGYFTRLGQHLP